MASLVMQNKSIQESEENVKLILNLTTLIFKFLLAGLYLC